MWKVKYSMFFINGKNYRYDYCCNVFTQYEKNKYQCNSCGIRLIGEPVSPIHRNASTAKRSKEHSTNNKPK